MTHLCNRIERDRLFYQIEVLLFKQQFTDVNKFLAVYNDSKYLFLSTKII